MTSTKYLLLCVNRYKDYCRILEIDRTSADLHCKQLPEKLDFKKGLKAIGRLLAESKSGSAGEPAGSDPLIVLSKSFVCKAYGIIGFPRFLDGHYIYLVVAKEKVGKLLGAMVYRVVEARLEMILNQEASCLYKVGKQRVRETKYLGIFNSLDMSDFYFSYDLDLTQNLETVLLQMAGITGVPQTHPDQS